MKWNKCGHDICYHGGPTGVGMFRFGNFGICCKCGAVNKNKKDLKERFDKYKYMLWGEMDIAEAQVNRFLEI